MKPLRLEIQGFTVFREKTSVNFEGRSLFAITGSIGAGKSSLLDAMMWARMQTELWLQTGQQEHKDNITTKTLH